MMAKVIEYTGWDYWTFQKQPYWLIELIFEMKNIESIARNFNAKRKNADGR